MGERVTFKSSTGPNLAGTTEVPERAVRGWGVFVHGQAHRAGRIIGAWADAYLGDR
jgi:hypothetical protein